MNGVTKITIARIIARLNVGGPALQAVLMTDTLRRRGYETVLLAGEVPEGEASLEYLAEAHGVTPVKISTLSRKVSLLRDLISCWWLIRFLCREKPFVVHTHTAKAGTLGRIAAILSGTPILVHTFHGHVFNGYFSPLTTRIVIAIERFLAHYTDRIIAISDSQKHELVDVYRITTAGKISVIPLGFDLDPFLQVASEAKFIRMALPEEAGFAADCQLIGWVGRLVPIKAPDLFLSAAAIVHKTAPAARFLMFGDGKLRAQCEEQLQEEGLAGVAAIAGWRRNMPGVYGALDLVVSTSVNEGTPVALLEAMAAAKPFIATDVGGVRDLMAGRCRTIGAFELFDNGILVPRDEAALSDAIRHLLERPALRESMGQAGREYVRTRYSHNRLTDDLECLYLSLAQSKCVSPIYGGIEKRGNALVSAAEVSRSAVLEDDSAVTP